MIRVFRLNSTSPLFAQLQGQALAPLVVEEETDILRTLEQVGAQLLNTPSSSEDKISIFMDRSDLERYVGQLRQRSRSEFPPDPKVPNLDVPDFELPPSILADQVMKVEQLIKLFPLQVVIYKVNFAQMKVDLLRANAETVRTAGMTLAELIERPFHELVHPDHMSDVADLIVEAVEKREGKLLNVPLRTARNGEMTYDRSDVYVQMPPEGDEGVAIVVNQQKRYEMDLALQASRAKLVRFEERFHHGHPCSYFELDENSQLRATDVSESLAALMGYSPEDLATLNIKRDLFTEKSLPVFADMLRLFQETNTQGMSEGESRHEYEVKMRHKDGTEIPIDFVATVGTIDGKTFVRADYTDARPRLHREELERERDRLQREQVLIKAKQDAGEYVAHDVDNGLTGVRSWIKRANFYSERKKQALQEETEEEKADKLAAIIQELVVKGYVEQAQQDRARSIYEMVIVITDACQYFQSQADKMGEATSKKLRQSINFEEGAIEIGTFRINSVVDNAKIAEQLNAKGIDVSLALHPEAGYVSADRKLLQEVIDILIENAVDAMQESEKRELIISTSNQSYDAAKIAEFKRHVTLINEANFNVGDKVLLSIQDTGEGIVPEKRREIFDPGTTGRELQPTSVTHDEGRSGMGLFRALSLIDRYFFGVIGVTSSPGHGSTFHILLPLTEPTRDSVANLRIG